MLGGERLMAVSRTPTIYADAAYQVVTTPADRLTGHSLIVEDVLRARGSPTSPATRPCRAHRTMPSSRTSS
ncbi:hypothetical protein [Tessaracoccus coleopterorum]|uniref:hypothetical protein n=1 Tax=Tessaracoccus coleopterorum TaxID=2714950 RepID=UPI0018D38523|nr:hypothetical protein [Tessaracoccus coleopterorum]